MAYGSLGTGQFLIWEVGFLGPGPIPVSFAFSASVSPFSKLNGWLPSWLPFPLP